MSAYKVVNAEPSMRWAVDATGSDSTCSLTLSRPAYEVQSSESGVTLVLPGACAWPEAGQPRLPVFAVLLEVSDAVSYEITVDPGTPVEETIGLLLPVVTRQSVAYSDRDFQVTEVVQPNPSIYENDAFWPGDFYMSSEARGMGRRYLRIALKGFHYNPVMHVLQYYPDLKVNIQFSEPAGGEE